MLDLAYKVSHVDTKWWLYAAGAFVVGALVDGPKLGALAGGAVAAYGVYKAPCCSGCGAGAGCGGNAPNTMLPPRGAPADPYAHDPTTPGAPQTLDPEPVEMVGNPTIKDTLPFEDVHSLLDRHEVASGRGGGCH
jgi:hypothetical protein